MTDYIKTNVCEIVREAEQNYASGTPTKTSKHVDFVFKDWIEKIEAYANSKHISGSTDALNREKPFFNITTSAENIWYRATDIDRKNIRVKATKAEDTIAAFVATVKLREFMRKQNFGKFLNKWGRTLARYGSALTKFVEKDGQLYAEVVPWNRVIIDPIDISNNVVIEILELTPAQLMKRKGYDREMVKKLLDATDARESLDKEDKDTVDNFIKLYEVHGELPLSCLTGDEADDDTYTQQMHVVSFVESKENGKYDEFTLVKGREAKDPYMLTHLIEEDGRSLARGAIEHLFEAQWMVNHTAKAIKDQLDLASKLIFQTADDTFVGQNALSAIETGDILVHAPNAPLTQVANNSHDITSLQNYGEQWQVLAKEITSTPEAISGGTQPSGTAWRQVEALQSEAHSLFELMTENKGLHIEDMMTKYIIPYIKKNLNDSKEIGAILESHEISQIDPRYIKADTRRRNAQLVKESLLKGQVPFDVDFDSTQQKVEQELAEMGNQRFFKPSEVSKKEWADIFENLEWELEVEVTSENTDKNAVFTTLTTVLQTIATNPAVLQDKNAQMLFNKILEETGKISPAELSSTASQSQAPTQAPAQALEGLAPQPT